MSLPLYAFLRLANKKARPPMADALFSLFTQRAFYAKCIASLRTSGKFYQSACPILDDETPRQSR